MSARQSVAVVLAMSNYRSQERRRLAAQCIALAQQSVEPTDRAFFLEMARNWVRLADLDWQSDQWRALQAEIGQALRVEFELPGKLSDRLVGLLARLDDPPLGDEACLGRNR